jgi:hypothetical protein
MKLEKTQCVYVIHNPEINITKIGISDNAERRMRDLQNACGCELILFYNTEHLYDAQRYETSAHEALAEKRRVGEWFNVSPEEAMAVVKNVTQEAQKDRILEDYKNGISISKIASDRNVSRQAIISRLETYGVRGLEEKTRSNWKLYAMKEMPIREFIPPDPIPTPVFTPIPKVIDEPRPRKIPIETYLDEEIPPLPIFKLKQIESNISYNGEWYQTSFYSEGEFCHAYTKDITKARDYIKSLKSAAYYK